MWRKLSLTILLLLVISIVSAYFYLPKLAANKLNQAFENADSVSFSSLEFDFWKGNVALNDFYLSDSAGEVLNTPVFANVKTLNIKRLQVWQALTGHEISLDTLQIGPGKLSFLFIPKEAQADSPKTKKGKLKSIFLSQVILDSLDLNIQLDSNDIDDRLSGTVMFRAKDVFVPVHDLIESNASDLFIEFDNLYVQTRDGDSYFEANSISLNKKKQYLAIKGFTMRQRIEPRKYARHYGFDKAHLEMDVDSILINELPVQTKHFIKKIEIPKIIVFHPVLNLFKDKRLPHPSKIKKFPFEALAEVEFPIQVDTISVQDGQVFYKETNRADGQTARLDLTSLDVKICNVTTTGPNTLSDWTTLTGRIVFYNSLRLDFDWKFDLRENGTAFLFDSKIGSAPLEILNPYLRNVANVQFQKGKLLGGRFLAEGNKVSGEGRLDFYYKDLKIELLDKKYHKKEFGLNIVGGAANVIIKNKNLPGKDEVLGYAFAEPDHDRFIIVYLWKLLAAGMQDVILTSKNQSRAEGRPNLYIKN